MVGINRKTGNRWRYGRRVRNSAGAFVIYPPVKIKNARPRSPRYLSEQERIRIADRLAAGASVRGIAGELGRAPSTISREIPRNRDPDGRYRPHHAEHAARLRACKPRKRRGAIRRWQRSSTAVVQTLEPGAGRTRAPCAVRRSAVALAVQGDDLPGDLRHRGRLTRPARRRRRRRRLQGLQRRGRLTAMRMIDERPAEVEDRVQVGHWEGDLIMGAGNRSAIGTLVERTTRYPDPPGVPGWRRQRRDGPSSDHRRARAGPGRAEADADMGSRQGACPAPEDQRRDRHRCVLLQRAFPVGAWQQREHERAAARLLPEGH